MKRLRTSVIVLLVSIFLVVGMMGTAHADMVHLGTAVKRFLNFRVVTVSLYVDPEHKSSDVLGDIEKRIEVNYHVSIPKKALDRATLQGIRRNYNNEEVKAFMPQIDQINSYYTSVHAGDRITVTYTPGDGTEVKVNGTIKGVVQGAEFAKAFFSIWVGKNPVDVRAKGVLLGHADGNN